MRTFHSNLKNTLLRLTPEQISNPESFLDDFFQNYYLCDIRPILWQWLKEVLVSSRESINDPHERNNDIFFYENVEALIEAAWIMQQGNNQQIKPANTIRTPNTNTPKAAPIQTTPPHKKSNPTAN